MNDFNLWEGALLATETLQIPALPETSGQMLLAPSAMENRRFGFPSGLSEGKGMPDTSHSCDLRTGRFSQAGHAYLVTATTSGRQPVFAHWPAGRLLVNEFRQAQDLGLVHSLAWVVMPDHLHWLFELRSGSLARVMQRVKSRAAKAINASGYHQGRLWQDGYHDKAVRREEDLVHFARYIVANPVRAGLVKSIRQYPLWDAVWV